MKFEQKTINNSIEDILDICKISFKHSYSKEEIFNRLKGKKYWIYLAKENNKVIGIKIWYVDEDNQIYSWIGAVHPDYRRKGIATELMKIQVRLSKSLGYKAIKVKTSEEHKEMINFLKKEGFNETGREPKHWGDEREAIFFEKSL